MVQNISQQQNRYGAIQRIGMTPEGRVVYQAINPNGEIAGRISIARQDCDLFEKSYRDIIESAPELQRYAQTTSPDKMMKKQKTAKWIVGLSTLIGGGIPLFAIKPKAGWKGTLLQIAGTLGGTIVGLVAGTVVAEKVAVPPGAKKFTTASKNLSKIDIRPA